MRQPFLINERRCGMEQSLMEKLTILADSAKYDVACTSSGASRAAKAGQR